VLASNTVAADVPVVHRSKRWLRVCFRALIPRLGRSALGRDCLFEERRSCRLRNSYRLANVQRPQYLVQLPFGSVPFDGTNDCLVLGRVSTPVGRRRQQPLRSGRRQSISTVIRVWCGN